MWTDIRIKREDLDRLSVAPAELLAATGLAGAFREVKGKPGWVRLEQTAPIAYRTGDEVNHLHELVAGVRQSLWMTVSILPPYRRYYVYLRPQGEQGEVLPQLLSMYAMTFYFGSITRYRPHRFDMLLQGPFGPRVTPANLAAISQYLGGGARLEHHLNRTSGVGVSTFTNGLPLEVEPA